MADKSPYVREVVLPSLGLPYGEKIPGGRVTINALTVQDERMLMGQQEGGIVLNRMLKSRVDLPAGFDPNDLLVDDRVYLYIQIRNLSFGGVYEYQYQCGSCKQTIQAVTDLDQMEVLKPTERWSENDAPEPFTLALPNGDTIQWRFLRGSDEDAVASYARQAAKRGVGRDGDLEYLHRLARHIVGINGMTLGDGITFKDVRDYVDKLYAQDSQAIRNDIEANRAGLVMDIEEVCALCGNRNEFALPLNARSFFRAHRRRNELSD